MSLPTFTRRIDREYLVCRENDLLPGTMKLVPIGKFGIGVYNVAGKFYAITNYCPHEGGPLCLGRVQGTTTYNPNVSGETEYILEDQVIRCPWHQWEFDLETGKTITKPEKGIRVYPVRAENGDVILTT